MDAGVRKGNPSRDGNSICCIQIVILRDLSPGHRSRGDHFFLNVWLVLLYDGIFCLLIGIWPIFIKLLLEKNLSLLTQLPVSQILYALFLIPNITHLLYPADNLLYLSQSGKISHLLSKIQSMSLIFSQIYLLILWQSAPDTQSNI